MTALGITQIAVFLVILTVAARFFGNYMAWVYFSSGPRSTRVLGAGERGLLRLLRINRDNEEQSWQGYSISLIAVSVIFVIVLYLQLRIQNHLPLNPDGMPSVNAGLAFNTATSFLTNTNWQYYGGESTMSYLSQMAGLAVQNFVSAAVGMAVLAAVDPRDSRHRSLKTLGQLLGRPVPLAGLHPAADLGGGRNRAGLPGRPRHLLGPCGRAHACRGRRRTSPAARWHPRSRSSIWAPTAAGSSTPTRPHRSRARRASPATSSCSSSC